MFKTLFIDVPDINSRNAHRQVVATLTHYGFAVTKASTKQDRDMARVVVTARHCANEHESAAQAASCALPDGTRVEIDHSNPLQ